jgi:uncharacterized membrane-anchored protein
MNSREEYTLLAWVSDVGGIAGTLLGVFAVISNIFSY